MKPEQAQALRAPFDPKAIGVLPKPYQRDAQKGQCWECHKVHGLPAAHLDYVGHAAVTDRLISVDPDWTWTFLSAEELQSIPPSMRDAGLWIKLTVSGVTRVGFGDAQGKTGANAVKEAIGDAIRNAAMRFGVALDLWSKEELEGVSEHASRPTEDLNPQPRQAGKPAEQGSDALSPRALAYEQALRVNKGDEDAAKSDLVAYAKAAGFTPTDAPASVWDDYINGVIR